MHLNLSQKPNRGYMSPLSTLASDLGQPLDDMAANTYCDIPSPEPACSSDSDEYIPVSQRRKGKTANRQRSWGLNTARESEEQEDKDEKAIREEDPYGWYRSRQRAKGGRSGVWEDDVERAFMIGKR